MIRVGYEDVNSIGKLAQLAGEAQVQEREAQRTQALADRAAQMQNQKEMMQFQAQLNAEAQKRAMSWELEKMELSSRHDFEMQEQRRQMEFEVNLQKEFQQKAEFEKAVKEINEQIGHTITPEKGQDAIRRLRVAKLGINPSSIYPQENTNNANQLVQLFKQLGINLRDINPNTGQPIRKKITQPAGQSNMPQPALGISPETKQAEQANKIRVVSPSGKHGAVPIEEWADWKAKGYQLEEGNTIDFIKNSEQFHNSWNPIIRKSATMALDKFAKENPVGWRRYLESLSKGNK